MHSLPLYTSSLLSLPLNNDIVCIEKPDEIWSFSFVTDYFSGLFLRPIAFIDKDPRCAYVIDDFYQICDTDKTLIF